MSVVALARKQSCPACASVSTDYVHGRKARSYLRLVEERTGQMGRKRQGLSTWSAEKGTFSSTSCSRQGKDRPVVGTDLHSWQPRFPQEPEHLAHCQPRALYRSPCRRLRQTRRGNQDQGGPWLLYVLS